MTSGYTTFNSGVKYDFVNTDFLYDLSYHIPKKILDEYYNDVKNLYIMIKELNPKKFTNVNLLIYYITILDILK